MDAATIEETNRIRLSLGMKPLPVPGATSSHQPTEQTTASNGDGEAASTLESRQAQAYDNYKSHMEADVNKRRREAKAAAVRKARDDAQRFALLDGKGLGEADKDGDVDTKTWLKNQKKRQKRIEKAKKAQKLMDDLLEAEELAASTYTSKDLAGLKVAHDSSVFIEGDEQILTLKDATIDENEEAGDELENINLRETEKLNDTLKLKKQRPGYNPLDDENEDGKRGILSQYDDEILGKQSKQFTLDANGTLDGGTDILTQPPPDTKKKWMMGLDDIVGKFKGLLPDLWNRADAGKGEGPTSSDYLAPPQVKFRKRAKNKHARKIEKKEEDYLLPADWKLDTSPIVVGGETFTIKKRKVDADALLDDDDELQKSLAAQRKVALQKRQKVQKTDIGELCRQVRARANEPEPLDESMQGGLVIGQVSEFIASLRKHDEEDKPRSKRRRNTTTSGIHTEATPTAASLSEDKPMVDVDEQTNDTIPIQATQDNNNNNDNNNKTNDGDDGDILDNEKTVGGSISATLALLRERGLIEESRGDATHRSQRSRQDFLLRKRQLEDELDEKARQQRERDRASGKLDRMSRADREDYARQQNAWRDQQHSRRMADLISSTYRPTVELKYTDEHGRTLDQKEAFKHLSHQFHGKGSGKGKTEKKLKQVEEEKRREAQSLFDASQGSGMSAATSQQIKKRKEAGVRLG
ncbi:hypothetical protein CDD80_6027 [Ophiocordyceps camponoti-rufipedis]|uniref:SART-1 protein n=1 Tax=Ophiocordyceps camponoti-rufipedis TaxID=2004952 RepID=A0A2C5XTA7_9HYPO|nr:hypothetical protein CDD80_6027 [Ophiocordyceps camponoti-rufipedis]